MGLTKITQRGENQHKRIFHGDIYIKFKLRHTWSFVLDLRIRVTRERVDDVVKNVILILTLVTGTLLVHFLLL